MTSTSSFKDSVLDVLCGSIAGASGKVIEYPFDTIKVRLQSQPDHLPARFLGPLDCFQQTIRRDGFAGLYRGVGSPIVGAAAENASLFLSYEWAQKLLRQQFYRHIEETEKLPFSALFVSGAISGIITSFILTPIELIKCQMQVQSLYHSYCSSGGSGNNTTAGLSGNNVSGPRVDSKSIHTLKMPGMFNLISSIYQRDGFSGFWRGQTGTLLREAGGSSAWFGCYEYVSSWFRTHNGNRDYNTTGESMIAGAVSGVAFNLSLFPADTIKSRIQTEALTGDTNKRSAGFLQVGKAIYRNGGIKALYRGCGITVARAAPSSAIIFTTYEKLKEVAKDVF